MKKKLILSGIIATSLATAFAFRTVQPSITGKVSPADAAEAVWAINATDTAKGVISGGTFSLSVKPGTYKVIIDAREPRRDVVLDNVEVKGQPVDVGEVVIQ